MTSQPLLSSAPCGTCAGELGRLAALSVGGRVVSPDTLRMGCLIAPPLSFPMSEGPGSPLRLPGYPGNASVLTAAHQSGRAVYCPPVQAFAFATNSDCIGPVRTAPGDFLLLSGSPETLMCHQHQPSCRENRMDFSEGRPSSLIFTDWLSIVRTPVGEGSPFRACSLTLQNTGPVRSCRLHFHSLGFVG